ncbi:MAG: DUF2378 family protein [Myxococcales bacterium]
MTTQPMEQAVVFEGVMEGIHRSFGPRLTPALREELRRLGVDFHALLPAYPLELWEDVVRRIARALYPELPEHAQWERMGFEWMEGYVQTVLGRAVLAMGRVIGPRRALERMGRNFRTAGNYLHAEAVVHGPTDVEVRTHLVEPFASQWRNRPSVMPWYRVGVLRGSLHALGVTGARVEVVQWDHARHQGSYRLTWGAAPSEAA